MAPVHLYRMHDAPDAASKAAIAVTPAEARRFNTPEHGFGVFLAVNSFDGPRQKHRLIRVNAWAVDGDTGAKADQAARLAQSPLPPTSIVETKRGFQSYWRAADGDADTWNAIVLERLVPYFGADRNARDICRILRAPGYLHLKDPNDPFLCKIVFRSDATYARAQMLEAFPHVPVPVERMPMKPRALATTGDDFWDAVYRLDCEEGLRRLSGHHAVGGEQFTFRPAARGHLNIFVDGKSTSCFLDENRKIGSLDSGGPSLYQWLAWYGNSPSECVRVIKELFPELQRCA